MLLKGDMVDKNVFLVVVLESVGSCKFFLAFLEQSLELLLYITFGLNPKELGFVFLKVHNRFPPWFSPMVHRSIHSSMC